MTPGARKQAVHQFAKAFGVTDPDAWRQAATLIAPDAAIHVAHPFNELTGNGGYMDAFVGRLAAAFDGLHRRDDILIGGAFDGVHWVSTHGNYVGKFANDLLGIRATGRLEYLRFGEFMRFDGDRIVEMYVFLDLPQLMIAAGQWPITDSPGNDRGYTGFIPGPMTGDGIRLDDADPARSDSSRQMVERMLAGLATEDQAWRPYWHEQMMWYGPAAFGSFVGVDDFGGFQVPFEQAFTTWSGGITGNGVTRHFSRFADGDYICTGGWPSLMCVQAKPFLGQPSKGETLFMRVCDWWRREGDLLRENWVFVDIPDVLLQMGVDLFPGLHDVAPGPRTAG